MRTRTAGFIAIITAAITTIPSVADAGGFLVARFGGEHGHPTTSHPSAMYYNPAGLAHTKGTKIYAEGLLAYRTVDYERPVGAIDNLVADDAMATGTPTSALTANSGSANLSNLVAAPFVAVVSDLGMKNLGVGVGAYVPFGGSVEWDQNDAYAGDGTYPGAVDGVQRWAAISGKLQSLYLTAAGAYHFPKLKLSVGAGFNLIMTSVETIRAKNASGTDDLLASTGVLQEGRAQLDVSGTQISLGVGAIWQPTDKIRVGLSYQSRPGFKRFNLTGKLQTKLSLASPTEDDVEMTWPLPDVVRAGISFRASDKLEVRVFGDFTRWSVVDKHCVMTAATADRGCQLTPTGSSTTDGATVQFNSMRNWDDTIGLRAGVSYWLDAKKEIVVGAGYDGNAVPDETFNLDLLDQEKLTGSIGARITVSDAMRITGTYTHVYFIERDVPLRTTTPLDATSRGADSGGTYQQMIGVFLLGAEYGF